MDHNIELPVRENAEVIHRGLHGAHVQASFLGDLPVERQHGRADVDHNDAGAGCGVQRALSATAGGQTEQFLAADALAQPAQPVDGPQRIRKIVVGGRSREALAVANHLIPGAPVLFVHRNQRRFGIHIPLR